MRQTLTKSATPQKTPQQLANNLTHNGHSAGSNDSQCCPSLPAALPTDTHKRNALDTPTRPMLPRNPPLNKRLTAAVGSRSTFVPPPNPYRSPRRCNLRLSRQCRSPQGAM
eukprot:scaffold29556_cov61-Attheya_sp.AAC.3